MIYINHSFHNDFFHRVFDGSTAPRMRAQYSHLSHEYDHGAPRELPGDTTLFSAVPRDTWGSQRKRPGSFALRQRWMTRDELMTPKNVNIHVWPFRKNSAGIPVLSQALFRKDSI